MTKISNAYIASDGEKLMKVGKENDIKRREKQIALPMTVTIICLDEDAAYRVESKLRNFVIKRGGIRHAATIDWFSFDPQIYKMLCEFAATIDGFEPVPVKVETEADIEREIAALRRRYVKLLEDELQQQLDEVRAEKAQLDERNRQLQEEIEILQSGIYMPMEAIQLGDDEYMRVLYQGSDEITDTLKNRISEQTKTYMKNFIDFIAPLHEEIGGLKAELRMLKEQYNVE